MILIVGATGVLGQQVTRKLVAEGRPVRVSTRAPQNARDLARLGAEVVAADLIDPDSLSRGVDGVHAVLASAHSLLGKGRYASSAVDEAGHRALVDAARSAGVDRFVYISARGAAPDHPVDFFRTKFAIETYLRASGLDYTILRPSAFMEWHVHRLLGKAIVDTGKTVIFGTGRTPTNFIAAGDVAQYAAIALTQPLMSGRTLELGGPDNVTRREIVAMYEREARRSAKVTYVPIAVMRAISPLLRPFNPVISRLMDVSVWSDTTDQTFDVRTLPQDLPAPTTQVSTFIAEQLQRESGRYSDAQR